MVRLKELRLNINTITYPYTDSDGNKKGGEKNVKMANL